MPSYRPELRQHALKAAAGSSGVAATFEARITTAGGAVSQEGTWKFFGGTGAFSRITGSGTFKGVMTSPTEVDTKWEGAYQLG